MLTPPYACALSGLQGVASRDIKLENTLLDGSERPLIKLADFGFSKDANMQSAATTRLGTPAYLAPEVLSNSPGQTYDGTKADIWSCGICLYLMVTGACCLPAAARLGLHGAARQRCARKPGAAAKRACTLRLAAAPPLSGAFPFKRDEDAALEEHQQANAMLQRILKADYMFPPHVPLSQGGQRLLCGFHPISLYSTHSLAASLFVSTEVRDLIARILVTDPKRRPTIAELQSHPWFEGAKWCAHCCKLLLLLPAAAWLYCSAGSCPPSMPPSDHCRRPAGRCTAVQQRHCGRQPGACTPS